MLEYVINRLLHAFFYIRNVIIPRERYRAEGLCLYFLMLDIAFRQVSI